MIRISAASTRSAAVAAVGGGGGCRPAVRPFGIRAGHAVSGLGAGPGDEADGLRPAEDHVPRLACDRVPFLLGRRESAGVRLRDDELLLAQLPERDLQLFVRRGRHAPGEVLRGVCEDLHEFSHRVGATVPSDEVAAGRAARETGGRSGREGPRNVQRPFAQAQSVRRVERGDVLVFGPRDPLLPNAAAELVAHHVEPGHVESVEAQEMVAEVRPRRVRRARRAGG